jgi:hypothetical protein
MRLERTNPFFKHLRKQYPHFQDKPVPELTKALINKTINAFTMNIVHFVNID